MHFSLREKMGLSEGQVLSLLLLVNSFYWYFIAQGTVSTIAQDHFQEILFPLSIIISSLVGSFFFSQVSKIRVLRFWVVVGTASSLLPLLPFGNAIIGKVIVIVALGFSLGVGMPSLLSFFVESTPVEHRGKMGGLTFFMVTACAPLLMLTWEALDSTLSTFVLTFWRSWSVLAILVFSRSYYSAARTHPEKREISFRELFTNKTFTYYLIAWLLFSLVDGVESSLWKGASVNDIIGFDIEFIEAPVAGLSALIGGILADWWGRKKLIIFGFVSLGTAYALIGIASQLVNDVENYPKLPGFIFSVTDGLAIGLLWSIFTIVIWGEISQFSVEKRYAVGEVPYFLTQLVYLILVPYMTAYKPLDLMKGTFSFAAIFLFVAVIPLLFVDETLPKRKIEERQLRTYTEEAIKLKQKVIQK